MTLAGGNSKIFCCYVKFLSAVFVYTGCNHQKNQQIPLAISLLPQGLFQQQPTTSLEH